MYRELDFAKRAFKRRYDAAGRQVRLSLHIPYARTFADDTAENIVAHSLYMSSGQFLDELLIS